MTAEPTVAVNTLSVTDSNEGIRTMLRHLLPALARVAPDLRLLLICSSDNAHLFEHVKAHDRVTVPLRRGNVLRRLWYDQWHVPRLVRGRADLLVTPSSVGAFYCPIPQLVVVPAHLALPSCRMLAGGRPLSRWHQLYYGPILRRSLRRADRVVGISQFVADGLVRELDLDPSAVAAMPLGVTAAPQHDAPEPREPMVLFAGTLYPYKDAACAVDAFARALPELPDDARLVVVGRDPTGTEIATLQARADAAEISDRVHLLGSVDDGTLESLYRRAAVLLMPSRCEGFGLPVAEAMSRSLPVVVSRSTSLPEVGGDAVLVIDPGDVDGFAGAVVRVLTDPELRAQLVSRGLRRADELSWDAAAARLSTEIRVVLA